MIRLIMLSIATICFVVALAAAAAAIFGLLLFAAMGLYSVGRVAQYALGQYDTIVVPKRKRAAPKLRLVRI